MFGSRFPYIAHLRNISFNKQLYRVTPYRQYFSHLTVQYKLNLYICVRYVFCVVPHGNTCQYSQMSKIFTDKLQSI